MYRKLHPAEQIIIGQVIRMRRITIDGAKETEEKDTADRTYDKNGRLNFSQSEIWEHGSNLDHRYTVKTWMKDISGVTDYYNGLGQVIRESRLVPMLLPRVTMYLPPPRFSYRRVTMSPCRF